MRSPLPVCPSPLSTIVPVCLDGVLSPSRPPSLSPSPCPVARTESRLPRRRGRKLPRRRRRRRRCLQQVVAVVRRCCSPQLFKTGRGRASGYVMYMARRGGGREREATSWMNRPGSRHPPAASAAGRSRSFFAFKVSTRTAPKY